MLGPLAEETLRQSMIISGGSFDIFVERGLSRALLVFIAVLVILPLVMRRLSRRRGPFVPQEPAPAPPRETVSR